MCIHRGDDVPVFNDASAVKRGLKKLRRHYAVATNKQVFVSARAEYVNITSAALGESEYKSFRREGVPKLSLYVKFALRDHAKLS
jgi:hypothetical protein